MDTSSRGGECLKFAEQGAPAIEMNRKGAGDSRAGVTYLVASAPLLTQLRVHGLQCIHVQLTCSLLPVLITRQKPNLD